MNYVLTVTAAALLAAIIRELAGNGMMGALVKFLAGLFVALTVLSPLVNVQLPDVSLWLSDFQYDGKAAAAVGKELAEESEHKIIKEQLEAYILDKAAAFGAALKVDVKLDEAGMPATVTLQGRISPGVKTALSLSIQTDLGLGTEVQQWIE